MRAFPNPQFGNEGLNGVVVHGSKINNMLWAIFGRYWGCSTLELQIGAEVNQWQKNSSSDSETSQYAIGKGGLIHDNGSSPITTVLTPSNLQLFQARDSLDEELLWPSPYHAVVTPDTLAKPFLLPP